MVIANKTYISMDVGRVACITDAMIINKILSYLDKHNLPESSNNSRTPPLYAPPSIDAFSDYTIQHDFDFGALGTSWGFHISQWGGQYQRPVNLPVLMTTTSLIVEKYPFETRVTSLKYS